MRTLFRLLAGLLVCAPLVSLAGEWTTRPLSEIALYPEYRAAARIESLNESRLAAEISGRIVELPVRVGERVVAGADLVRLDEADYRIAVDRAQAQVDLVQSRLRLANAQLEQSRALAVRGYYSDVGLSIRKTELEVLESELAATRHALTAARLQHSRTVIRAPFEGVVRERLASVGDLASPGTPLLVFASTAETEIHARVPVAQVVSLQRAVRWSLQAGEREVELKLERVLPLVEPAGQTQVAVFSAGKPVAPGLAGEVRWRGIVPHLPPEYLVRQNGQLGAWIEREGRAEFVVLTDASVGRAVAVDWVPGTRVIDEGRMALGVPRAGAAAGAEGAR